MNFNAILTFSILSFSISSCQSQTNNSDTGKVEEVFATENKTTTNMDDTTSVATFGAGCFWCVEAVFQDLEGVKSVASGYMGGKIKNPTYREVCTGLTGHAEVLQVVYNPQVITFDELLEVFWQTHDPTTLNQQGADKGTQYRSAVFYHTDEQKQLAEKYKAQLDSAKAFSNPIVTEISSAVEFYVAEDYHQNYYNQNGEAPYCRAVIQPKVEKMKKVFGDKLKKK